MTNGQRLMAVLLCSTPVILLIWGCSQQPQAAQTQAAQESLDIAVTMSAEEDAEQVEALLTEAIERDGLETDQWTDAVFRRAQVRYRLQKYDEALADLEELEPGAPDLALLLALRAEILLAAGKTADAKVAARKARLANPRVKLPRGV